MRRLQLHLNCWGVGTQKKPFPSWLWAIFSVVALCLAAIRPRFQLEGVCSDDLYFHLLRLAQLKSLVRQGDSVPITPEPLYGRITFAVLEGVHAITIRFSETPLRRWANGISLFTLVALLGLALYLNIHRQRRNPHRNVSCARPELR